MGGSWSDDKGKLRMECAIPSLGDPSSRLLVFFEIIGSQVVMKTAASTKVTAASTTWTWSVAPTTAGSTATRTTTAKPRSQEGGSLGLLTLFLATTKSGTQ